MIFLLKNVYIDRLDNVVNEYHNTYSTIKMKHVGVNSSTYSDFDVEDNDKDPKLEVGDYVRIPKSKIKTWKRLCSKLVRRCFYD